MKTRNLAVFLLLLLFALILVSCNPEKEIENGPTKFPSAINNKTFKLETGSKDVSTNINEDFYYITTNDTKVTVDACVSNELTSYTTDVTIVLNGNTCTATGSNGSTYTFTTTSNSLSGVTVENKTTSTLSGSFASVKEIDTPDGWTFEFKKYEGRAASFNDGGSGSMRLMVTPIGVYYAVTYDWLPETTDPAWDYIKSAEFFRYDTISVDENGVFHLDSAYSMPITMTVENAGYEVFLDTGNSTVVNDQTFHVKESDFDDNFFFQQSITWYMSSSSEE